MDQDGESRVPPVHGVLVDKVGGENHLRPGEVVAHPEENPRENEQVVQDIVACYVGSGVGVVCLFGEQIGDVAQLVEEEEDPFCLVGR